MNDDIDYNVLTELAGADGHDGSIWNWIDIDYGNIPQRLFRPSERPIFCDRPHFYDRETIIVPRETYLTVYRHCYGRYPFFGNPFPIH